jgi:hypothetical protein
MLVSSRYGLTIRRSKNGPTLFGKKNPNRYEYQYELTWDACCWATGTAHSPKQLGKQLGAAIEALAHAAEGST